MIGMTTEQRERLREAREAAGLSQRALSEATGIHYVSIARYETGVNRPDVYHALAVARALGTTVERLFGDDALAHRKQGGAMTYQAEQRLQITLLDGSRPAEMFHEDRGDGTPVCNIPLRPLEGQAAKFTSRGPGEVTCGRCARVDGS
jgi:putative transcriptional regulator